MHTPQLFLNSRVKKLILVNVSSGFEKGIIPLGLISIATYVKKYGGYKDVTFLDANCQDIYRDFKPARIVGVGAVSQDIGRAIRFAQFVKSKYAIPTILGGVHISTYKKLPSAFDVGVIGEGEEAMLELMRQDSFSPGALQKIKGICFKSGEETIFTKDRDFIAPLDNIPIPDRSIANMDFYLRRRQIIPYYAGRSLTIMTSRGCPFNCVFCSTKVHWNKFRAFSAGRVVEEIEQLIAVYKAQVIHIFDDLFIADKARLREIHGLITRKKLNKKVKFMCLLRSDMLDDSTVGMLKDINVVMAGIGMESGSQRMLSYLKKNTATIQKNHEAIALLAKYNIPAMGSFIVGSPHETEQDLFETLRFIRSYRYSPYLVPLSYIAAAFPGTEFWDYAKEKGIETEDFSRITMDIPKNIAGLKRAHLLTDIPVKRFYHIIKQFDKEGFYNIVKKHIFLSRGFISLLKAYFWGARIEGSVIRGIKEVSLFRECVRHFTNNCRSDG